MLSHIGVAFLCVAALAATAPGAGAASIPESTDPIVLGKLDWTGQEITGEVAGEILRRMGYKVEFVQTTIVPMFQAVADGEISAYLEQWNASSKKYYDEYTQDGRIEGLGEVGLKGREGWFYPDYVEQQCPGLPNWSALKNCAELFSTPDTAPKGRLLDYPAEWTPESNLWIDALGLDYTTVPSGGEGATAAEVKSAVAREEPLILMWWEPTWLASIYKLKPVEIDEEGCAKAKAAGITSGEVFDCAGAPVAIVKYVWPSFKDKWPAAYKFLKAFQMTNDWQGPMAMAVEVENAKPADVAKKWVDENQAIWQPWVDAATQ